MMDTEHKQNSEVPEKPGKGQPQPLSRRQARRKVFELLFELAQHPGVTIEQLLKRTFEEHLFDQSDAEEGLLVGEITEHNRDFIITLCRFVTLHLEELDNVLGRYPHEWRFDRIGAPERTLLRMALAELLFMETPFKIVINEALDLTKLYGEAGSNRFLNGILGSVVRDLESLRKEYVL